jgi:hypothetical protein
MTMLSDPGHAVAEVPVKYAIFWPVAVKVIILCAAVRYYFLTS